MITVKRRRVLHRSVTIDVILSGNVKNFSKQDASLAF